MALFTEYVLTNNKCYTDRYFFKHQNYGSILTIYIAFGHILNFRSYHKRDVSPISVCLSVTGNVSPISVRLSVTVLCYVSPISVRLSVTVLCYVSPISVRPSVCYCTMLCQSNFHLSVCLLLVLVTDRRTDGKSQRGTELTD